MNQISPIEATTKQRYAQLGSIFIDHPHYSPVYQELRLTLLMSGCDEEPPCVHLTGPPGVGKTTLKRKLFQEFRTRRGAHVIKLPRQPRIRCDHVPLLRMSMPEKPTVKALLRTGLRALGDSEWDRGNELTILNDRFDAYVEACGVLGILIDDAHRAVDGAGVVTGAHIAEWLTARYNKSRIVLILAGLGRTKFLFHEDLQLARRWNQELRLEPYKWVDDEGGPHGDQAAFIAILRKFRDLSPVPFDREVDVDSDEMAYRCLYASHGLIGLLKKILKAAIFEIALADKPFPTINLALLERAYDKAVRGELRQPDNPFRKSFTPKLSDPPPPLRDDSLLLPPREVLQQEKTRRQRNAHTIGKLTKR